MHIASMFVSRSPISGYSVAIARASRTMSPDVSRMTFAFSTTVTVLYPYFRACSNALRRIRRHPPRVMMRAEIAMSSFGTASKRFIFGCKAKALRIGKDLGLDVDQLQKDAEDPDIKKALDEAKDLAQKLGLQGTPLFLIGDRTISGAPDDLFDQLKTKVTEVRQKGCAATC